MKVIVDNGAYSLRNMGDVAMLQVCLARIRQVHPGAEIRVLIADPEHLDRYCPGALALNVAARDAFFESHRVTASPIYERWRRLKTRLRIPPKARVFSCAFESADAVVVAGGGFLNDINVVQTRSVLRMLAEAGRRGYITALFGQGLGPLENPEFRGLLGDACSNGTHIGLRESRRGPLIIKQAGLDLNCCTITGDDAIELASAVRRRQLGSSLGLSLRSVGYSALQDHDRMAISNALQYLRNELAVDIVPVPISFNPWEDDPQVISSVAGPEFRSTAAFLDRPMDLIAQVARCRVMLTATYHGGVFALSQGIPCICLYRSNYYRYKMEGLAGQFPHGCEVLDLAAAGVESAIIDTVQQLWDAADELRLPIIASADKQVQAGKNFYQSILSRSMAP
jgi:polysaccharide pyruvyl transferase WcaK-like protein